MSEGLVLGASKQETLRELRGIRNALEKDRPSLDYENVRWTGERNFLRASVKHEDGEFRPIGWLYRHEGSDLWCLGNDLAETLDLAPGQIISVSLEETMRIVERRYFEIVYEMAQSD